MPGSPSGRITRSSRTRIQGLSYTSSDETVCHGFLVSSCVTEHQAGKLSLREADARRPPRDVDRDQQRTGRTSRRSWPPPGAPHGDTCLADPLDHELVLKYLFSCTHPDLLS